MTVKEITILVFTSLVVLSLLGMVVPLLMVIYSAVFDQHLNLQKAFMIFWMSGALFCTSVWLGGSILRVIDESK